MSELAIPDELSRSLPRVIREIATSRSVLWLLFILDGFLLRAAATMPGQRTLPVAVGPLLMAAFLSVRPFNPYQSGWARLEGINESTIGSAGEQYLGILRSQGARRTAWKIGLITSAVFTTISTVISVLTNAPISWQFRLLDVVVETLVWAALSGLIFQHYLLRWAIREWRHSSV